MKNNPLTSLSVARCLPISLVAHFGILLLLAFLWKDEASALSLLKPEKKPQEKMADHVREMHKIRDEMAAAAQKREKEQAAAVKKEAEAERPKTRELLTRIEAQQSEARDMLESAAATAKPPETPTTPASEKKAAGESAGLLDDLAEKQKKITEDQKAARDAAGRGGASFDPATEALAKAQDEQDAANAARIAAAASAEALTAKDKALAATAAELDRARAALAQALERAEKLRAANNDPEALARQEGAISQSLQPDVTDAETAQAAATAAATAARESLNTQLETALAAQTKAAAAQAEAAGHFDRVAAGAGQDAAPASSLPALELSAPAEPQNAEQAVSAARQLEEEAREIKRRQRAAELAMIQKIPLEEAYNALAAESAPAPAASEKSAPADPAQAEKAVAELAARVRTLQRDSAADAQTAVYLDWVKQRDQADAPASDLVKSGTPGSAVDLVAAMQNQGTGTGGEQTGKGDGEGGFVRTAEDGASKPPVIRADQVRTVPGRTIGSDGVGADWMTVDTWYVVGPFANAGRVNRNLRFTPEERVDLDATYPGADGKPLRWEFLQSTKPAMQPVQTAESVFYAYTEVWMEEAQNLWVAIGCDDNAKVWIEDQLIYRSDDQNKGWDFAEALRRVHFKKGLNRILYRVENGPNVVAYSLAISLRPNEQAPTAR